jgi:Fic-DOC domain mobile mystery protein B
VALIGEVVVGETPLTAEDLQGLKLPLVKTRAQLNLVEGANIVAAKEWAMKSRVARMPNMLTIQFLQTLHRRMLGDVWEWAGEIRTTELQNEFAAPLANIRPDLLNLYKDTAEHWLNDKLMSADEFAARVHHRIVKIHPFRNGNGRHSRLLADLILERHFGRPPFTWGGNANLGTDDAHRPAYLVALKAADQGNYAALLQLCRAA